MLVYLCNNDKNNTQHDQVIFNNHWFVEFIFVTTIFWLDSEKQVHVVLFDNKKILNFTGVYTFKFYIQWMSTKHEKIFSI